MDRSRIIFETVVGSRAYGTARPDSDEDLKGIFIETASDLLTLGDLPEQKSDARGDVVHYSLRRFLSLALKANPTIIEMLFMPKDCLRRCHRVFELVLAKRKLFVTKQAFVSHARYAQSQIRKARGQNKWVNNPQPDNPPSLRDFCWFIPAERGDALPFRPIPISAMGFSLEECHASALEHSTNVYRLYHYGPEAQGVFRGESLVCASIPRDDEKTRCVGLLIFNENAYRRAKQDYTNYWTWRTNRNEQRWESQERGKLDYDAKNLMHAFRLMLSAEHILTQSEPLVRFTGEPLQFLKDIRAGRFSYRELMERAESLGTKLEELHAASALPSFPDAEAAEVLLKEVTNEWERQA